MREGLIKTVTDKNYFFKYALLKQEHRVRHRCSTDREKIKKKKKRAKQKTLTGQPRRRQGHDNSSRFFQKSS